MALLYSTVLVQHQGQQHSTREGRQEAHWAGAGPTEGEARAGHADADARSQTLRDAVRDGRSPRLMSGARSTAGGADVVLTDSDDALLEALLEGAISVIDAPLAAMARLPQHARQVTSTAMHRMLLDMQALRGMTTTANQASQAHVSAVPTADQASECGSTLAARLEAEAQVKGRAREEQAEAQRLNKQTQEIRSAHTQTVREHAAAYAPMEVASNRLKDAANTSWSLLIGHEPGMEGSAMDAKMVKAAQEAEDAIFRRVEAEMQRYGIVDRARLTEDADVREAADVPSAAAQPTPQPPASEGRVASAPQEPARSTVDGEIVDALLRQLKSHEDPQEVARRSDEEAHFAHIRRLGQQEGSKLQELFARAMRESEQQTVVDKRQRFAGERREERKPLRPGRPGEVGAPGNGEQ